MGTRNWGQYIHGIKYSLVIINDQQAIFVELVEEKSKSFLAIKTTLTLNVVHCKIIEGNRVV